MVSKYLAELLKDETNIQEAGEAYESAKARLDVGLRRYLALREFVTDQLGQSPYSPGVEWPETEDSRWDTEDQPVRGHFRFTGMKVGDAITLVLREADGRAKTLDDIVLALSDGGLGFPDPVQARAVNAALIKPPSGVVRARFTSGRRSGELCYKFREPEDGGGDEPSGGRADIDPDDLPFE